MVQTKVCSKRRKRIEINYFVSFSRSTYFETEHYTSTCDPITFDTKQRLNAYKNKNMRKYVICERKLVYYYAYSFVVYVLQASVEYKKLQ